MKKQTLRRTTDKLPFYEDKWQSAYYCEKRDFLCITMKIFLFTKHQFPMIPKSPISLAPLCLKVGRRTRRRDRKNIIQEATKIVLAQYGKLASNGRNALKRRVCAVRHFRTALSLFRQGCNRVRKDVIISFKLWISDLNTAGVVG